MFGGIKFRDVIAGAAKAVDENCNEPACCRYAYTSECIAITLNSLDLSPSRFLALMTLEIDK